VVNLPIIGWKQVDLIGLLRAKIDLPCFVENDANAAAFGSIYTEAEIPSVCSIFLKLDEGCGGATIVDGRLLRGANGTAGEFGHIRVSDHGPRCGCGQIGCLETHVGLAALAISFHGTDELSEDQYATLPDEVAMAVENGDERGLATIRELEHWLSLGLVSLVNLFNPTTIILGGPMLPVAVLCLPAIRDAVTAGVVPGVLVPDIRLSALGKQECAVGAATVAHHHTFDISYRDIFGDAARGTSSVGAPLSSGNPSGLRLPIGQPDINF
jgi:predicted NBD/HSP70 family sugar kinase